MLPPTLTGKTFWAEVRIPFLLSLVSLVLGFEILVIVSTLAHFVPLPVSQLTELFLPEDASKFHPSRTLLLYRIFLIITLCIYGCLSWFLREHIQRGTCPGLLRRILVMEYPVLVIIFFALYGIYVWEWPGGNYLLGAGIAGIFLTKLFLGLTHDRRPIPPAFLRGLIQTRRVPLLKDVGVCLFIIFLIYVPDPTASVARIFRHDYWMHLDGVVMAPAWSFLKGCIPYIDVRMQYGMGMPILAGTLSQQPGDFSYENVLMVLMGTTIVYYLLLYFFLRIWLKNFPIALTGVLLTIAVRHFMNNPFAWDIPNTLPSVRHFFDIPFFLLLQRYLVRQKRKEFLILAAMCAGFSVFYVIDTGIYLLATYYAALLMLFFMPGCFPSRYQNASAVEERIFFLLLPPATLFFSLWAAVGSFVWKKVFWGNLLEFSEVFISGLHAGSFPVLMTVARDSWTVYLACLIIVVYVVTACVVGNLCFFSRRTPEHLLVVLISIYGLCFLNYFLRFADPSYLRHAGIPFILTMGYWCREITQLWDDRIRKNVLTALTCGSAAVLLTSVHFVHYPHRFNTRERNVLREEKSAMTERLALVRDVHLIATLTAPRDKVCVISSFETLLLMQADRRPFFYYFPFTMSIDLESPLYRGPQFLHTQAALNRVMNQLETEQPKYIFIERKLYTIRISRDSYYRSRTTLTRMLKFLRENYQPVREGNILVALEKK